ncbi:hypothetical protein DFJ58DRAFT_744117 [Suillus subalutaceus]|uniref:uncharacterized protein n=1 Tax=Suillus subalutaceus TaxID=48586 RepID=UPI001B88455B|nr:uncharacterized protein DFJ58DRAFT_744117 [Suillus subalutaceus]KAG1862117.1 hypothetical protein DFJ58DRAFT_744117 [Suillus subalutaceus]
MIFSPAIIPPSITPPLPHPIAFVSIVSDEGVENLAPFSVPTLKRLGHVVHTSTALAVVTPKSFEFDNLLDSRSVNVIDELFVGNTHSTTIDAPPGFDEWTISGGKMRMRAPATAWSCSSHGFGLAWAHGLSLESGKPKPGL